MNQLISYALRTKASLYSAYMAFIQSGGLFIKTLELYSLGDLLDLELILIDETELYSIPVKVVWITPLGAQKNKPQGIGVQFLGEKNQDLVNKIEGYLGDLLQSIQITDTI